LEGSEIKTKKDFMEHKQLLKKVQKENSLDYNEFYAALSGTRKQLADDLRKSPITISAPTFGNSSIFKKFSKLKKLSPITKEALLNNLKEYNDSPHLNNFKR
jgi:hypothetical protein